MILDLIESFFSVYPAATMTCTYSGDFGAAARLEWKFQAPDGSQSYVIFNGKPTGSFTDFSLMSTCSMFKKWPLLIGNYN